jgi:antitoxin CptB
VNAAVVETTVAPGQLLWRCRRGMRELDELLSRWLRERYSASGTALQADFRALLELPDPDIAAYLLGRAVPEAERVRALIAQIRAHLPVQG